MGLLNDPLKILPLLGYLGAMVLLAISKVTFEQSMMIIAASGAGHAVISTINNRNPK